MLRTGVDLVEVPRLQAVVDRHGERFLARVFTPRERAEAADRAESLAARFAAKEAVMKALGHGLFEVGWQEIEVIRGENRQPELRLHGRAQALAAAHRLSTWSVSLSHTTAHAIALVVATSEAPPG